MYRIVITVVFCIFAEQTLAAFEPTFEMAPPAHVEVGTPIEIKCAVNEGPSFMASNVIRLRYKNAKATEETAISTQGNLVAGLEDQGYTITFSYDPVCSVHVTIPSVTDAMDGKFFCHVTKSNDETPEETVEADMMVLGGIGTLKMTVNGEEVTDGQELENKPGNLDVGCISTGSNPLPDIHLKLGGEMIVADVEAIADPDSTLQRRSFQGSVTHVVDFKPETFGKVLECHAETLLPEGVTVTLPDKTVSVTLQGIVDEPIVKCTNNTASIKDRRVTLTCLVGKNPPVKRVFYNVGNRYNVYPGNQTKDLIECEKIDLNTTYDEVILKFYEMEDWHFTSNIYLDVQGYDGAIFQFPVYLLKGDDDDNVSGASSVTASFLLPTICMLLTILFLIRSS